MSKEKLVIIRKWKDPEIRVCMTDEAISMEMASHDYLVSLVEQINNVPFTITKTQLLSKLQEAHKNIVAEMKLKSVHSV